MIKDLLIQNLILIESCPIQFDPTLSIITGETGAGKTAILQGLKLLLGQKLDTSLIRRGEKKGFVQARFELSLNPDLLQLLSEAGIDVEDSTLLLSREISTEGKSKSWINNRLVTSSFLQKVGSHLIQIVDQHSYHELKSAENQRLVLDLFASTQEKAKQFKGLFEELKQIQLSQEKLIDLERQKERENDFYLSQLQEISSIQLKEGEEDLLFEEYTLSLKAEEISTEVDSLFTLLGGPEALCSKLAFAKNSCVALSSHHEIFQEAHDLLQGALLSTQETLHLLQKALSFFDPDPKKTEALNQKLQTIDRLKKKYGASLKEWMEYKIQLQQKIDLFAELEEKKEKLIREEKELQRELTLLAKDLTDQRILAGSQLEQKLSREIQRLNMNHAIFHIHVEKQQRTSSGEDLISFWLTANQGEGSSPIKDSSSGGELSRLLFAIKICLAEKNNTPTLIFDEIDAGVGGETARLIGEQLKELSLSRQVICITHFPQVACQAHLHLQVQKHLEGQRTFAKIEVLNGHSREVELLRMLGGEKTLSFYENS